MKSLKNLIKQPLSTSDLSRFLADSYENVLTYSELSEYNDMNDLLPIDKSYKIILIEYKKDMGHWICFLRYDKTIEIFNSFGTKHDDDDFVDSDNMNNYLGQSKLYLNILIEDELKDGEFSIIYNKIKFQEKSININTCGRHVVNRILCMQQFNMTLKDYIKFMKQSKEKTKLSYDELVTKIIS